MTLPLTGTVRSRWSAARAAVLAVALALVVAPACARAGVVLSGLDVASTALDALPEDERQLLLAINAVSEARLDSAERYLEAILARRPHHRLARLVYGDVLLARSGQLANLRSLDRASRVEALLAEARARIAHVRNGAGAAQIPDSIIAIAPDSPRIVLVDVGAARLYLYDNEDGIPRLRRSVYVSTAKNGAGKEREGDQRTPIGVYFITGAINPDTLPDFYGVGALPVNYPNEWDMRRGRTGYGIWLHGVPGDTFARPPRASDGCVALSNDYMQDLLSLPGMKDTPVVFADRVSWIDREDFARRRAELLALLAQWRADWESRDVARYARHYSDDFRAEGSDRASWIAHKRRVNTAKRFIRVRLENVNAFAYPGEDGMMVVDFDQDYRSSNYSSRSGKRQYWKLERDGVWRIVHEGAPRLLPVHLRGMPFSARTRLSAR